MSLSLQATPRYESVAVDCQVKCGDGCSIYEGELGRRNKSQPTSFFNYLTAGFSDTSMQQPKAYYSSHCVGDGTRVAEGHGKLLSKSGVVLYEGGWLEGYRHGFGKGLIFKHNDQHKDWRHDGVYEGYWKGGLREGTGTFTDASGNRYEGEWVKGRRQGKGIIHFLGGGEYRGQFADDERHGPGLLIWPSGKQENQEYAYGKLVTVCPRQGRDGELRLKDLVDSIRGMEKERIQADRTMQRRLGALRDDTTGNDSILADAVTDLENNLSKQRLASRCLMCKLNPREGIVMPCLHFCYCLSCIQNHLTKCKNNGRPQTCPYCKTVVSGTMKAKVA